MGYRTNKELWARQENNIYHRIGSSEKEYQANEFAAAFLAQPCYNCQKKAAGL